MHSSAGVGRSLALRASDLSPGGCTRLGGPRWGSVGRSSVLRKTSVVPSPSMLAGAKGYRISREIQRTIFVVSPALLTVPPVALLGVNSPAGIVADLLARYAGFKDIVGPWLMKRSSRISRSRWMGIRPRPRSRVLRRLVPRAHGQVVSLSSVRRRDAERLSPRADCQDASLSSLPLLGGQRSLPRMSNPLRKGLAGCGNPPFAFSGCEVAGEVLVRVDQLDSGVLCFLDRWVLFRAALLVLAISFGLDRGSRGTCNGRV